jgi:hypothetical protein
VLLHLLLVLAHTGHSLDLPDANGPVRAIE